MLYFYISVRHVKYINHCMADYSQCSLAIQSALIIFLFVVWKKLWMMKRALYLYSCSESCVSRHRSPSSRLLATPSPKAFARQTLRTGEQHYTRVILESVSPEVKPDPGCLWHADGLQEASHDMKSVLYGYHDFLFCYLQLFCNCKERDYAVWSQAHSSGSDRICWPVFAVECVWGTVVWRSDTDSAWVTTPAAFYITKYIAIKNIFV